MLLFAGCAKEELTSEPQEIGFRAYNFKQTKAPIEGAFYGTDAPNFKVFAALVREGNYLTNFASSESYFSTEVAYDGADAYKIWRPWTGNAFIKYYWPMSGSLTFVAVSPATAESAFADTTATLTVTDFSSSTTVAEQADLMYSKIADADNLTANTTSYPNSSKQGVPVVFNHALAQVRFMAVNNDHPANTVQIDKIQITNVANKGTLTVVKDVVATNATDGSVDGWKTTTIDDATFVSLSSDSVLNDAEQELGLPIMIIPQTLADDIMLEVTYTMTHINGENVPDTQKTVSKKLSEIVGATLNANKKYTITLKIGADEILFSPSIVEWSETTNVENYPIK
jgi:hypothetical protein